MVFPVSASFLDANLRTPDEFVARDANFTLSGVEAALQRVAAGTRRNEVVEGVRAASSRGPGDEMVRHMQIMSPQRTRVEAAILTDVPVTNVHSPV